MGKIISPAGEVAFKIKGVKNKGTELVILGVMGVWDAEIILSLGEALRMLLNRNIPLIIIKLPIMYLRDLFKNKKT